MRTIWLRPSAQINEKLREIAKLAKIDKKISTHVSRHTFAKQAIKKGTNIQAVQDALGHSSIKQTQGYLADLNTDELDKAFDGFYD